MHSQTDASTVRVFTRCRARTYFAAFSTGPGRQCLPFSLLSFLDVEQGGRCFSEVLLLPAFVTIVGPSSSGLSLTLGLKQDSSFLSCIHQQTYQLVHKTVASRRCMLGISHDIPGASTITNNAGSPLHWILLIVMSQCNRWIQCVCVCT